MKQHNDTLAKIGLSLTEVRRNIRAVYAERTPFIHDQGMTWYDDAHKLAVELAYIKGVSIDHTAVMIAHLSPRTQWVQNQNMAWELVRSGDTRGTMRGAIERAKAALAAVDPWSTFGKAPKTRSFAANIRGDLTAVTIDMWAMQVAGVTEQQLGRVGVYEAVAHAYRLEAKRAGIMPAQMQAITWVVARGKAK